MRALGRRPAQPTGACMRSERCLSRTDGRGVKVAGACYCMLLWSAVMCRPCGLLRACAEGPRCSSPATPVQGSAGWCRAACERLHSNSPAAHSARAEQLSEDIAAMDADAHGAFAKAVGA